VKAIVLAAGPSTRLDPITALLPKPLAPVVNRPVMQHLLALLRLHGGTDVAVNLHAFADALRAYFGDGSALGVSIRWSAEPELLGTAGAVKALEDFRAGETVLVLSGDDLHDIDLAALVEHHRRTGALATLAVKAVDDPSGYGMVVSDPTTEIIAFQEKPPPDKAESNLVSCGVYVVEPEVLERVPAGRPADFGRDVWPALANRPGALQAFVTTGFWSGLGDLDELRRASLEAVSGRVRLELAGEEIASGIRVEDGCSIDVTATLEGPLAIGMNVAVEADAVLRGPAVVGANSRIGVGAVVSSSVLLPGTVVPDEGVAVGGLLGDAVALVSALERYPAGTSQVWG
jgi:NDP-sugar pyrophosphorylase family protein